jgi:hypothetical protein
LPSDSDRTDRSDRKYQRRGIERRWLKSGARDFTTERMPTADSEVRDSRHLLRNNRNVPGESGGPATDVVKTLGQLFGLAAGFIALVYAAGGGVLALRLYLSDLPSRTVVGQLPRDLLISVGLSQIVLPALGVAAIYLIARLLWGNSPPPTRLVDEWGTKPSRRGWRVRLGGWRRLLAASTIPALVATGFAAEQMIRYVTSDWQKLLFSLPLTFLVTLIVVLVALNLRARLALSARRAPATNEIVRERWNERSAVVRMTSVVAFASLPFCLVFAGTINLLGARVCITGGSHVDGVLIGETTNRTYIGENSDQDPLQVFAIPQSEIIETIIGGGADETDCLEATP